MSGPGHLAFRHWPAGLWEGTWLLCVTAPDTHAARERVTRHRRKRYSKSEWHLWDIKTINPQMERRMQEHEVCGSRVQTA